MVRHCFVTLLIVLANSLVGIGSVVAEDWPQWLGPTRDGRWNETGLLDRFPAAGANVLWRKPIAGGYAGPAVANGRVFVTDFARSQGEAVNDPGKRAKLSGQERTHCLDARTGKTLWTRSYDCTYEISYPAGPRCTPTVDADNVYTLGAEGNLECLDIATGAVLWARDFKKDFGAVAPMWGFCSHPLVDGDKVICGVGGKGSTLVSFDKQTGREVWRALSAPDAGYSAPDIIEAGGVRQLVFWDPEAMHGLDPETGHVYWSKPLKPDYGMSIMSPRHDGDYLFAGGIGGYSLMLKLASDKPTVTEAWRGTRDTSVHPVNSPPFLEGGYIYGVDKPGQLRCVEVATGKRLWETSKPTSGSRALNSATAFLVKNGDRFFIMSETGDLIIARLSPEGYSEISRAKVIEPTHEAFGRIVLWSHPAFANRCAFIRNDKEIVCVSLEP